MGDVLVPLKTKEEIASKCLVPYSIRSRKQTCAVSPVDGTTVLPSFACTVNAYCACRDAAPCGQPVAHFSAFQIKNLLRPVARGLARVQEAQRLRASQMQNPYRGTRLRNTPSGTGGFEPT